MDWGIIVGWLISVIVLIAIIYFSVHAAVLRALKDHTKWVDGGKNEPRQRLPLQLTSRSLRNRTARAAGR